MQPDLDAWLREPQVRTHHRQSAGADPDRLWDAAGTILLRDAPTLSRVVRWRIPGTPADLPFRDLFGRYPFAVLDEGERWSVSGLCGRVWTLRRDYPRLDTADEFRAWDEPGTVRVLFAHWVEPDGDGRAALVSESRVKPVDRRAGLRLRALWSVVGRLERLIGSEALRAAARSAESR
ncbi:MAG TPA: hypothetical protein VGF25_10445 [Thermoleophilaceae bacterium]|jgi:hypothetical protein